MMHFLCLYCCLRIELYQKNKMINTLTFGEKICYIMYVLSKKSGMIWNLISLSILRISHLFRWIAIYASYSHRNDDKIHILNLVEKKNEVV